MTTRKQIIHLSVATSDLQRLKIIKEKLPSSALNKFEHRYGGLLDLLMVKVQSEAITALVQFYDPPLRCFTFQDFQFAPTLEEIDTMLGFSKIKKDYCTGVGKEVKMVDLAKALGVSATDLEANYKTDGDIHGIKKGYLEAQALSYAQKKQWDTCGHFLALLIFGLILLPKTPNFVDPAAIHAFIAFRISEMNPTPTILANIYYNIHTRHEKKRGALVCCVQLLYSWLTSHIYKASYLVKDLTRHEWSQKLRALEADSIFWYVRKLNYEKIIYKYGEFDNVPLIGTLGCINYNPILDFRQLGHPMEDKPSDKQVKELLLYDMGKGDPRELKRVIQAWKSVQMKNFGPKNVMAKDPYTKWVKERVKEILLPFIVDPEYKSDSTNPGLLSIEETKRLRVALEASQKEKEKLELQILQLSNEKSKLGLDLKDKNQELQLCKEESERQRGKRKRATEGVLSAGFNLDSHNERLRQANMETTRWKRYYEQAAHDKKEFEDNLESMVFELTDRTNDQERQIRELKYDLQQARNSEREERERRVTMEATLAQRTEECRRGLLALTAVREVFIRQREHYEETRDEKEHWKIQHDILSELISMVPLLLRDYEKCRGKYDKLIFLCNDLIRDIPKSLERAESSPIILPEVVKDFMELCRSMVDEFKADMERIS